MNIILLFYLKKIIKIFKKKKKEIFKSILKNSLKKLTLLYNSILKKLDKQLLFEPIFLEKYIWFGYCNKSQKFSNYYLFLILTLLNLKNDNISRYFVDEKIDLKNKIINFKQIKFTHIKITIKILIKKILKNDLIFQLINNQYRVSPFCLLNDLSTQKIIKLHNNNVIITNAKNIPIKTIFCDLLSKSSYNKLKQLYKNKKENPHIKIKSKELEKITFLNETNFNNLICHLFDLINESNKEQPIQLLELIAKMLSKMSKFLLIFWEIEISYSNSISQKDSIDKTFTIENTVLIKLFQIIISNNQSVRSSKLKMSLVKILTNIIPDPKVYQFYLNIEDKFYSKLYLFLRNAEGYKLAKLIFKLVFTIIIYNPGAINDLINNKKLHTFLALISSSSTLPLVASSLYFLSKMLTITELISKKNKNGASAKQLKFFNSHNFKQKMFKSINQIHNTFINFFVQNFLFVKLNMVFMKYIKDKSNNNNKFISFVCSKLFNVYNIILTKPYCNKIKKRNKKKLQYKEGILFFQNICFGKNIKTNFIDYNNSNSNKTTDNKKSRKKLQRWFNKK
ncbi:hypothetical protein M0812_29242 [Anaeramoeba flamelloides]|uniref:Uncharacterized protein n=1 Tax=Anaeramoeba flamelloides TaxID=1746091 RepID=A0AAV7Y6N8_9EUKA|nr:hypothetical protein M0812_29242 [Anaeramoeba flamelloides]